MSTAELLVLIAACVLLFWAWLVARLALRGAVAAFLRGRPDGWSETRILNELYGPLIYQVLHELESRGLIVRREELVPGRAAVRGDRPVVSYRWIGP